MRHGKDCTRTAELDNPSLTVRNWYALRKERTTVQKQMDEALRQLYEAKVPEAVRDYLDNKNKPTPPKRPPRHTKAADSVEKKRDLEVQEDGDNRDGPVRERQ